MVTVMLTDTIDIPHVPPHPVAILETEGITPIAVVHFSEGIALTEQERYQEAVDAYEEGLRHAPGVTQAWYNKGTALGELGDYREALEALNQALRLNPNYADAWHNKGIALTRLGKREEALNAFEQTRALNPDDALPWLCIGSVLLAQKKTGSALTAFEQARDIAGSNPIIWLNIGVTSGKLGRYADANSAFQTAYGLKDGGLNGETLLYKAWAASCLSWGVSSLLNLDTKAFEEAGFAYIAVSEKAQQDDAGGIVEAILTQYKNQLNSKKQRKGLKAFEELELFINLTKIKDPFEGWRALGEEISKVWPKGLSAVDAVREMRR